MVMTAPSSFKSTILSDWQSKTEKDILTEQKKILDTAHKTLENKHRWKKRNRIDRFISPPKDIKIGLDQTEEKKLSVEPHYKVPKSPPRPVTPKTENSNGDYTAL